MPKTLELPELANPLVVVVAYNGLCTFEFAIAVEIFGLSRPEMGANWYQFALASVDPEPLCGTAGIRVLVDGKEDLIQQAGTVILPGWRGLDAPVPERLIAPLRVAHENGARILSICTGAMVTAAAGLLNGRKATLHWQHAPYMLERYPEINVLPDVLYVDDGELLSSAGGAAGIDLCLHLIRRDFGTKAANMVARRMIVQPHRDGGQRQFIEHSVFPVQESGRVGKLLDLLREDLSKSYSISSMAELIGMSRRTLLRRFESATGTTPAKWLVFERVARSVDLLENTKISIEEVSRLSGFASVSAMRQQFQKQYSVSPAVYRKMFGQQHLEPLTPSAHPEHK